MDSTPSCPCSPDCKIPYGLCHCGCREPAPIAEFTSPRDGWTKGLPKRFVNHHAGRTQKTRCPFPLDVLHRLYWLEKRSSVEIADLAAQRLGNGVAPKTARRWLREAGYSVRSLSEAHKTPAMRAVFLNSIRETPFKKGETPPGFIEKPGHLVCNFAKDKRLHRKANKAAVAACTGRTRTPKEERTCAYPGCGEVIRRCPSQFNAPPSRTTCSHSHKAKLEHLRRFLTGRNSKPIPADLQAAIDRYKAITNES